MNKNLIKKEYLKKIKQYENYNKKYFDENQPIISDSDYDNLKNEIIELEKIQRELEHHDGDVDENIACFSIP